MSAPRVATNGFKAALARGEVQIGLWQALASPACAEICAAAGFDWLLFDGEHGPNDVPLLLQQLHAVSAHPVHPVGRVPIGEVHIIKQYLDIGFQSLLVPLVESAEQATTLARACRYPPDGLRGVGTGVVRASGYNRVAEYLERADGEICLVVQVETRAGLESLDAIAAVEGVDAVFIGPADLAAALGHRGQPGAAPVQSAIADAISRVRAAGKPVGILAADETLARRYIELGCGFVAVGTDVALLARGSSALAARFGAGADASPSDGSY